MPYNNIISRSKIAALQKPTPVKKGGRSMPIVTLLAGKKQGSGKNK